MGGPEDCLWTGRDAEAAYAQRPRSGSHCSAEPGPLKNTGDGQTRGSCHTVWINEAEVNVIVTLSRSFGPPDRAIEAVVSRTYDQGNIDRAEISD